jgi:hypothetical protein
MGALKSLKCSKGHKMADPNLYYRKDGQRQCKKCKDLKNKEQEAKRKKLAKMGPRLPPKPRPSMKGIKHKPHKPHGPGNRKPTLKMRIIAKGGEVTE